MTALAGRTALVSGGAQGIGAACVSRFLSEGAAVAIADIDVDAGTRLAESSGGRAYFVEIDVRDPASWARAIAAVEARSGRLDILVNNAGIARAAAIETATDDDWRSVLSTNLDSVFFGTRAALRLLGRSPYGAIVNIASALGLRPKPDFPAYSASKGGVRALSKAIALDCARQGYAIRCNTIYPGSIRTAMSGVPRDPAIDREAQRARTAAAHPLGRIGEPEEVAAAVFFLASDEASFITGAELTVDGGLTI